MDADDPLWRPLKEASKKGKFILKTCLQLIRLLV